MKKDELADTLAGMPGWTYEAGADRIEKTFSCQSFLTSIAFVKNVASIAEDVNHHPEILIQYDKVTLRLRTHDEDKVTDKDLSLATAAEKAANETDGV
ncbi:4a-hydroxytetrahydrobiopterin dehydratase [Aureibacillus halotolerans]|uniref:4a-hydroxytetrahydrobiopterin dehydratase n=1 Tax=Aureibacillus halotolerans TaxID=1508390 RepID=A0A4R6U7Z4_9BACI|nr:4a-hydroxytetrahydrobiopterin dehydratase [Aureibacillus halotolerans]TDQ42648.1 4a-hydroxytetrahydrobiopterin dehydratase [Aureibacillus halotolerans]